MTQAWLDAHNGGSSIITGWRFSNIGWNFGASAAGITDKQITFVDCEFLGLGQANGSVWWNTAVVDDPLDPQFRIYILNNTLDGQGQVTGNAEPCAIGGQWIARRNHVTDYSGFYRGTSDDIEATENWCDGLADIDPAQNPNPHTSWFGFNAGSHILVQRNWIRCGTGNNLGASGAVVCYGRQNSALNSDVVIKDNAAQGGGSYVFYCGGIGDGTISDCHWTGNIFYRDDERFSGQFGTNSTFDTEGGVNSFTGNTWGPFVKPPCVDGDPAEGTLIVAA